MSEKRYILALDYDEYGWDHPDNFLHPHELLELVRLDAHRFLNYPIIGGTIVIKRSYLGYHLKAPFARLTREDQEAFARMSFADTGYKYWIGRHGKATLRIDEKVIMKQIGERFVGKRIVRSKPQVIEIIKRGDGN